MDFFSRRKNEGDSVEAHSSSYTVARNMLDQLDIQKDEAGRQAVLNQVSQMAQNLSGDERRSIDAALRGLQPTEHDTVFVPRGKPMPSQRQQVFEDVGKLDQKRDRKD